MPVISSYALQYSQVSLAQVAASSVDLFITEGAPLPQPGSTPAITDAEVAQLRAQGRIVVGYVNVSVTDDNRGYWNTAWTTNGQDTGTLTAAAPNFLRTGRSNAFGIITDVTDAQWQQIVINQAVALVQRGYNGVFLDDLGTYFIQSNVPATQLNATQMAEFVAQIDAAIRAVDANAFLVVNSDPYLTTNVTQDARGAAAASGYLGAVDAHVFENLNTTALAYARDVSLSGATRLVLRSNGAPSPTYDEGWQYGTVYTAAGVAYNALGDSSYRVTAGADTIDGGVGPNQISTLGGNDVLTGGGGDDVLNGGTGNDTMSGGTGNDQHYVDAAGDTVIELAGQGNDRVFASASWTLAAGSEVETVSTTDNAGTSAINLTGNELAQVIIGNAGANTLNGGLGRDVLIGFEGDDILIGGDGVANQMQGGQGRDVYFVSVVGDTIVELANEGTDQVRTALSQYALSANIEELVYIGTGNFYGIGNDGDNVIVGGAGSDSLDGGLGRDTLNGGAGDDFLTGGSGVANVLIGGAGRDIYYVSVAGDTITENAGEGNDQVRTSLASFTLSTNVEELVYIGTASFSGIGNDGDNIIVGGAGGDTLNGGLGADILNGGDGDDILIGGDGAANTLIGGLGRDIYFVSAVGDSIVENAGEGTDQVRTALNRYVAAPANVEELVFTGTGDFVGTLGAGSSFISGGVGNDTLTSPFGLLRGFAGDDALYGLGRLEGGTGNDRYFVGAGERSVVDTLVGNRRAVENAGEGIDEVITSGATYYLDPEIENLTYVGSLGFRAFGNAIANVITGGPGRDILTAVGSGDTLVGGTGTDDFYSEVFGIGTMIGGAGDDTYYINMDTGAGTMPTITIVENAGEGFDQVRTNLLTFTLSANLENLIYTGSSTFAGTGNGLNNTVTGGALADLLTGLDGDDVLRGYGGADTISGGNGDDDIGGGAGNDLLTGGTGRDSFLFDTALDGVNNNDALPDFAPGLDRFLLDRAIFSGLAPGQLSGIAFGFGSIATTADQRILYDPTTGSIRYDPDGAGGAAGVIFAHVATQMTTLSAADFVVIG